MSDRIGRDALNWFSTTTLVFWLATIRGAFDGSSYEWGIIVFSGQGMRGDYWFPLLAVFGSMAVLAGGWRGKSWAFIVIAVWSLMSLSAVIALAVTYTDDFRFRGDTMGIDFSLVWTGPMLFGAGSLVSILAAWQAYQRPVAVGVPWNVRNLGWLAGMIAVLPIQFVLLRFGDAQSLADQIGVLITVTQWFLIDRVFRPSPLSNEQSNDSTFTRSREMMKRKISWVFGGLGLVALGLAILAAPSQWEGPILLPISPGHALSVLDTLALVPLLVGTGWLYYGLWQHRQQLYESLQRSPLMGSLGIFVAGTGMGLLLASSFSAFFWWWAIGALLYGVMLIVALNVAA